MSEKRYIVRLTSEERAELEAVLNSEKRVARQMRKRAQILLKVDQGEHGPGWTDAKAADAFDVRENTVRVLRQRSVEEGLERALHRKKQKAPSRLRKLDGAAEARLIAALQGGPPEGRSKWSLRLLSDKVVELGICEEPVSHETIRQVLKKTRSSRT